MPLLSCNITISLLTKTELLSYIIYLIIENNNKLTKNKFNFKYNILYKISNTILT